MPRPSKTDQELAAIRDCWKELRVLEAEYQGETQMWCTPSARPGVFTWRMIFTPLMGGKYNYIGAVALSFQYPNTEQSTFAGFLWRKAVTLSRMVLEQEEVLHDRPDMGG